MTIGSMYLNYIAHMLLCWLSPAASNLWDPSVTPRTINMLFTTCYFWASIESFLLKLFIGSFLSLLGGWSPREDIRRQKLLSKRLQKWMAFQPQLCFLTLQRYVPYILVLHLAGTSLFGWLTWWEVPAELVCTSSSQAGSDCWPVVSAGLVKWSKRSKWEPRGRFYLFASHSKILFLSSVLLWFSKQWWPRLLHPLGTAKTQGECVCAHFILVH